MRDFFPLRSRTRLLNSDRAKEMMALYEVFAASVC